LATYEITLEVSSGSVTTVLSAIGPDGSSIVGATGWTFNVTSTSLTVVHPLAKKILNPYSYGVNGSNVLTRAFTGTTTGTYSCFQNSSFSQINFYSLTSVNAGFAGTGDTTLTITFQTKI
jgi:hypothetical protein